MSDTAPQPSPVPYRRSLRVLMWLSIVLILLVLCAMAGIVYLKGRPMTAPDWLQTRIEARIAHELPQARVTFGEMMFVVDDGWVPKVRLRDVSINTPSGEEVLSFNEFKAAFALEPLLEGIVQPRAVALSGVFVNLQRDENGRLTLSAGTQVGGGEGLAVTPPQLIAQIDQILSSPSLSALNEAELRALTLRYVDTTANRAWTVDGGYLRMVRTGDNVTLSADLAVLSGGAGVATLAANYESTIGDGAAQFGVSFDGVPAQDIAAQGPAFAWLDVLRAPISGSVRSGLNEAGTFEPVNATLQIGAGVVQPNTQTKPIPFEGARSYFSYDPQSRLLQFDELSLRSKWVTGQASGTATLGDPKQEGVALGDLVGQFNFRNLRANPDDLYPDPVSLEAADLDFQMKLNPFRLQLGRLQITDQGQTLLVDGALSAGREGWEVALDGQMDGLLPNRLLALWPARLASNTRNWLAENLLEADVRNIDLAFRQSPGINARTHLAFDYTNAKVRFMRFMPPLTNGQGHLSLSGDRLVIALDSAQVTAPEGGKVALQGSSFIIPDVRVKDGTPAVVRLETRSSMTAALSLLNQKPMQVMDKAKMPVDLANGQAMLRGTIALPLKKRSTASEVRYHVEGDLLAINSNTLVKDRTLQGQKLKLKADNSAVTIAGIGRIDGVRFDGVWTQPIGEGSNTSTLRGQLALDQNALNTFGISLPKGTVNGAGSARVAMNFQRGVAPKFSLNSDLRGIRVAVPQVSWVKPSKTAGRLEVAGSLGPVPKITKLQIEGAGLSANGTVTLKSGGTLERVRFDRLRVSNWLNIPVDLYGQGAGKPVQVVLRGGSLDLRRAEFDGAGGGGGGPPSPPMQVKLDRLQITDTIALTNIRGRFGTARGLDGKFEALLNGATPVKGQVIPQNGRSAVKLSSNDAGGVLRSAGLLKQVVGGKIALTLLPVGSGGAFDGRLTAGAIRVKDAPGIAALLNAISVVGLVNELNGDGIYFEEVEGDFRLTSDRITLTKSSAVGASMGLSMDGVYGLKSGNIQMQGVISPVYLLNGVGSVLTRKGEGVIGFNYSLSGPVSKPKVSVNPLSALTPSIFREIFRRPAPNLPEVEGITDSTLPKAETQPSNKPVEEQHEGR